MSEVVLDTKDGHIEGWVYYEKVNILEVTFKGGTVDRYHPVNPENFAELIRADSLQRAIHKTIRSGLVAGVRKVGN